MKGRILLAPLVAVTLLSLPQQSAHAALELKAWLGSAYTVPGEESELWLTIVSDTRPTMPPLAPEAEDITLKFLGDPVLPNSTRERTYAYRYAVVSYTEGVHVIPPFSIKHQGITLRTQPLKLHVASLPDHVWFEQDVHGQKSLFASKICIPRRVRFEGETTPAEIKVYLPARFKVDKATIAEVAHDGVAAGRFDISSVIPGNDILITTTRLKQQDYLGLAYRSTITPLHEGAVSIGPGLARLTLQARISKRGFTDTVPIPLNLPLPKLSFTARPLPGPAPAGFQNAVGQFIISIRANTSGLREEEPVSVQLTVTGTGNLDTLSPPELTGNAADWKSYPSHRLPRQGARSDASGAVTFSQTIRPNGIQKVIPSYQLISFDPDAEQYVTAATPPISFDLAPSAPDLGLAGALLPDRDTPVEEMESILGLVTPNRDPPTAGSHLRHAWHLLPALLSLVLLAQIARTRLLPRFRPATREIDLQQALASIEHAGSDSREFLRATGSFIEHWIPEEARDEETKQLLTRRDHHCYKPGGSNTEIGEPERRTVITHLKRRALEIASAVVFLTLLDPGKAHAAEYEASPQQLYQQAEAAWDKNAYRLALHLYHEAHSDDPLPADVLYNIGNCYFRLGEPGLATLYYRRALHRNPQHPEALQNLRFLRRKTGAIATEHPTYQQWLGRIPRPFYENLIAGGLWIILLASLSFFSLQGLRRLLLTGLSVGPVITLAGGVCLLLYPDDLAFAPVGEQATMINKDPIMAGTEAASIRDDSESPDGSAKVIELPPGSLCRLIATRGTWTYIELANGVRGWVPSAFVRSILPIDDELPAASGATR